MLVCENVVDDPENEKYLVYFIENGDAKFAEVPYYFLKNPAELGKRHRELVIFAINHRQGKEIKKKTKKKTTTKKRKTHNVK